MSFKRLDSKEMQLFIINLFSYLSYLESYVVLLSSEISKGSEWE